MEEAVKVPYKMQEMAHCRSTAFEKAIRGISRIFKFVGPDSTGLASPCKTSASKMVKMYGNQPENLQARAYRPISWVRPWLLSANVSKNQTKSENSRHRPKNHFGSYFVYQQGMDSYKTKWGQFVSETICYLVMHPNRFRPFRTPRRVKIPNIQMDLPQRL